MKRSKLVRWHLYAGLFTSLYLIAFGFSSLIMNHNVKVENLQLKSSDDYEISVDSTLSDRDLANSIRDQLNLMGWTVYWQLNREGNVLKFPVTSSGRLYRFEVDLSREVASVEYYSKGILAAIHGMHFLNGKTPNSNLLIRSFGIYQYLGLLVMLFSLLVGLFSWWKFVSKPWEKWLFGLFTIFSCIIMLSL